jgi:membrane-bound lytic murein transglycosylase D
MEERVPRMSALLPRSGRTPRGIVSLAILVPLVLAGCAAAPQQATHDWPMVPSTPSTTAGPKSAGTPTSTLATSAATLATAPDPASLVSLPVPDDATPMADLSNVFDRIRLGYALPDVVEPAVDRSVKFFVGKPDFLDRTFERAERYLYYVARELEQRHMPLELAMLPVIESAYNPYAFSRARAAGVWQFIAPTATRHQVKVNWWQDGRRDIVDSTRAALDYLTELNQMFDGDWLLAIAAYNCGELNVQRAIDRNRRDHKPTDFWHLKLPGETRGYVPALLAMARIVANPDAYGLEFAPIANKPYFAQVEVGGQLDLRVAAAMLGIPEDELHALNPAFNRWATDPTGPHHLLVPAESASAFATAIADMTADQRMPVEHYVVGPNDTIQSLANERDIPIETIKELNGVTALDFHQGIEILLPAMEFSPLRAGLIIENELPPRGKHGRGYVVHKGETLASIAKRTGVPVAELARLNGLAAKARLHPGTRLVVEAQERARGKAARKVARGTPAANETRRVSYVVKKGDTLHAIGRRFAVSVDKLREWNRLSGPDVRAGQKLVLYLGRESDYGG